MSGDAQGRIDGTIKAHLLSGFPDVSSSPHDCDVIVVPVSTFADYRFNPKLRDIKKPWVLLDYTELEWNYFDLGNTTLLFGQNAKECRWLNPHWHPLHDFVREHPPIVHFKRELLEEDECDNIFPIDWPCALEVPAPQTEQEFEERPIEVFNCFGYSHPARPLLHADIFRGIVEHGLGVISEAGHFNDYFKSPSARTWVSIFAPHYARIPIATIQWYQERSKLSVSLPGCGRKCFRMAESPVGSIMALRHDGMAYSYAWEEGRNCIRLNSGDDFFDLDMAIRHRGSMYEIYLASQETIRKYQTKTYVQDYVTKIIADRL